MKKLLLLLVILGAISTSFAQSKVGTVDIDYILSQMPELQPIQTQLNEYIATLDKDLQEKLTLYQQKLDTFNKDLATFTEEQNNEKRQEIYLLEEEITKFRDNGIQLVRIKEDELKRPLYEKIAVSLDKIAKAQNFTQILSLEANSNVVYLTPDLDVSLAILQDMGISVTEE